MFLPGENRKFAFDAIWGRQNLERKKKFQIVCVFEDKHSTIIPFLTKEHLIFSGYGKGWTDWKICSCESDLDFDNRLYRAMFLMLQSKEL